MAEKYIVQRDVGDCKMERDVFERVMRGWWLMVVMGGGVSLISSPFDDSSGILILVSHLRAARSNSHRAGERV